jgi:DsbC/DsbD-like thiol-disulfide interchange protein
MKNAILASIIAPILVVTTFARAADNLVRASILADVSAIEPGKPFTVGVQLKLAPSWHVYWINPGDSGIATKVTFDLPEGFSAGEVMYPVPHRFDLAGGLTSYGYADEVMLLATITPPKDLKVGADVAIKAKVGWLVCQENCIKGDAKVNVALKASANSESANQALFEKWRALLPQKSDDVQQAVKVEAADGNFKGASGTITMEWKKPPEKVEWFPAPPDQLIVNSIDVKTEGGKSIVTFKVEPLPGEKVSDASISSVLAYTVDGKLLGLSVPIKLNANNSSKGS